MALTGGVRRGTVRWATRWEMGVGGETSSFLADARWLATDSAQTGRAIEKRVEMEGRIYRE